MPWQENGYSMHGKIFFTRNEENKIIYYDLKGKLLPNFNDKFIYAFDNNNIFMKDLESNKIFKVDSKGFILEDLKIMNYDFYRSTNNLKLYPIVDNKVFFVNDEYNPLEEKKIYSYDLSTKIFSETSFYFLSSFINNRSIVKKLINEEYVMNLVDKNFKEILKENYSSIKFANNTNYIIVGKRENNTELFGILDLNGKEIFPIKYEYIDINDDNIILYKINNSENKLEGIISDIKGNILYKINSAENYDMMSNFILSNNLNNSNILKEKSNNGFGEIFYHNKYSKSLTKLSDIDFLIIPYTEEGALINNNKLIYSLNNKYYVIKK